MGRTLRFRASDDERILLEADTLAYRLHAGYELGAAELDVPADTHVRIELLDDSDHLLDRRTYLVPVPDPRLPSQEPDRAPESRGPIPVLRQAKTRVPTAR
jgi:hypothetical protein